MAAFIDEATANEIADRFLDAIAASGFVYWLSSKKGSAASESTRFVVDGVALPILPFFSHPALARAVQEAHYPEHDVQQMSLFDFLYRWLPQMGRDRVAAGLDWRRDLCGPERDPAKVLDAVEFRLTSEMREKLTKERARADARTRTH